MAIAMAMAMTMTVPMAMIVTVSRDLRKRYSKLTFSRIMCFYCDSILVWFCVWCVCDVFLTGLVLGLTAGILRGFGQTSGSAYAW